MFCLFSRRSSGWLYFLAAPAMISLLLVSIFRGASPAVALPDPRAAAAEAFLADHGWQVDPASCRAAEVAIPERFGKVYRQYNELLRARGYDLTPYRGRRAARFTFTLARETSPVGEGTLLANVLFVENKIVAADICDVGIDGFLIAVGDGRQATGNVPKTTENG